MFSSSSIARSPSHWERNASNWPCIRVSSASELPPKRATMFCAELAKPWNTSDLIKLAIPCIVVARPSPIFLKPPSPICFIPSIIVPKSRLIISKAESSNATPILSANFCNPSFGTNLLSTMKSNMRCFSAWFAKPSFSSFM